MRQPKFDLVQVWRLLAICAAAVVLMWPALVTRYPFMIPDSIVYARGGRDALSMLWNVSTARQYIRSPFYCIAIFWLHRNVTPWPVIVMNGLLLSWSLWLVVRSIIQRRPMAVFLGLVAALSFASTISWHVSSFMPDILGGALYCSLYLLVFARETLRRWETIALFVLTWWTAGAHLTHPVLALATCGFLGLLWLAGYPAMRSRGRYLVQVSAAVLLAIVSLGLANLRMFGSLSLSGPQPPYLMARIVADGPSHWYLATHCPQLHWTICRWAGDLPFSSDTFLWTPGSVYQSATPQQREDLVREQLPLIKAVLRTTPRSQLERSWFNFKWELIHFAIDRRPPDLPWVPENLDGAFPGARQQFLVAFPKEVGLHRFFFAALQERFTWTGAAVALALLPWLWRRNQQRLLGLYAIVGFVAIANAMLTGVLSTGSNRYQGRIAWLLPMLGALAICVLVSRATSDSQSSRSFDREDTA